MLISRNLTRTIALSCLSLSCNLFANDIGFINLNEWSQVGDSASGDWAVNADGSSVFQSINGHPTAFMSSEKYSNRTFRGVIQVAADAGDDDYVGMIFGDPDNNFYIFDWKQGSTGGVLKGFRLFHFNGSFADLKGVGWGVHENETGLNTILASSTETGWVHGREYGFEMQLYPNRIVAKIDGATIFDVKGLEVEPSRFGFFNWSQGKVTYNAIEHLYPPIAENKSMTVSQGFDKTVIGTWTDKNVDDTHTCELAEKPQYGKVTYIAPCSFKYIPDPDHDGLQTFSYRITDSTNLYTDGEVSVNVMAGGSSIVLPSFIEADATTKVSMKLTSVAEGQFQNPSFSGVNVPNFMKIDSSTGLITMTPTSNDLGLHENITLTASNGISNFDAGTFDLKVMPKQTSSHLEQEFLVLTSEQLLLDENDMPLAVIDVPAQNTGENVLAEGPHQAVVTANSSNKASIFIQGVEIAPGKSKNLIINLDQNGTKIPLAYSTLDQGNSLVSIAFPWLDSPHEQRYVSQRTCSASDSTNCTRSLDLDRNVAPEGEIQVAIRKGETSEYLTFGLSSSAWNSSDLQTQISKISDDDIIAVNVHVNNANTRAFLSKLASSLSDDDLTAAVSKLEDNASLVFHQGNGLKSFKTATANRWGTTSLTWVD